MSALYLGVVVLPLVFLIWNLGLGGVVRRKLGRTHSSAPLEGSARSLRFGWLRALPATLAVRVRSRFSRSKGAERSEAEPPAAPAPAPVAMFELAPDVPRSPSSPGWVPASGYAARPRA